MNETEANHAGPDAAGILEKPVRRLNDRGLESFSAWVHDDAPGPAPAWMLDDPGTSEPVPGVDATIRAGDATLRYEVAERICRALDPAGVLARLDDGGLWAWLALLFSTETMGPEGRRRVGVPGRHVLVGDVSRQHDHLVRTACLFYVHFGGPETIHALSNPPDRISRVEREMLKRRNTAPFLRNPEFIRLLNGLFGARRSDGGAYLMLGATIMDPERPGIVSLIESLMHFHGRHGRERYNLLAADAETMADLLPPLFDAHVQRMRRAHAA